MSEWRKHGSLLTKWELKRLYQLIHTYQFTYTYYSYLRMQQRDISEISVERVIKFGKIVEFHYKDGDKRVLIRGVENVNGQAVCVVLSLSKRQIITVYQNDYEDKHYTLNKSNYKNNIDIMKYMNVG